MKNKPFSYLLPEPLSRGSQNDEVWLLQAMLASISRHFVNLVQPTLNGIYDRPTEQAVLRIQKACGLPATGTTDQETWDHIIHIFCSWRT